MTTRHHAIGFACQGATLQGVLTEPASPAAGSGIGVVVVVGGPQYRVGSHRQFVQLARLLAEQGHAVLRFDVRGMGDSTGNPRSFEALDDDIAAALDTLHAARPGLRHTLLWGLCDGASAALMYVARRADRRVSALCLANPWVRSEQSLAKAHVKHYYWRRLRQPEFWRKLLSGGVALAAARELARNLRLSAAGAGAGPEAPADFRTLMARGWRGFGKPMLLLTSDDDYTAKEFLESVASRPEWAGALATAGLRHVALPEADHTFSTVAGRLAMQSALSAWIASALPSHA